MLLPVKEADDKDVGEKADKKESEGYADEAEESEDDGGLLTFWCRVLDLFRPAHSRPRNANRGTGAFFAKGKPTATTTNRHRSARFGNVEANPLKEGDPATKTKAHGEV